MKFPCIYDIINAERLYQNALHMRSLSANSVHIGKIKRRAFNAVICNFLTQSDKKRVHYVRKASVERTQDRTLF